MNEDLGFNVYVKMGKTVKVLVKRDDTMLSVKQRVTKVLPGTNAISFRGKILDDDATIASCNIFENQTLHGVVGLRGGGLGGGGGLGKQRNAVVDGMASRHA